MDDPDRVSRFLDNLQRQDEECQSVADAACRRLYASRVITSLRKLKQEQDNEQFAEDLVTGKVSLDAVLTGDQSEWEGVIRNACAEYQGLKDASLLLFNAPDACKAISKEHDQQAREIQLKHFYNVFTTNKDKSKCPYDIQTVYSYRILKQHMENFMQVYGTTSKRVVIVFNGHGKETGHLSLAEDDRMISNTDFLKDIHTIWKKFKTENPELTGENTFLPTRVTVVLAQCFGYKHEQMEDHKSVVDVACLTNEHQPETRYVFRLNTLRHRVRESVHVELVNFARDEVRQERMSSGSDDRSRNNSASEEPVPVQNSTEEREKKRAIRPEIAAKQLDIISLASLVFSKPVSLDSSRGNEDNHTISSMLQYLRQITLTVTQKKHSECTRLKSSELGARAGVVLGMAPLMAGATPMEDARVRDDRAQHGPAKHGKSKQTKKGVPSALGTALFSTMIVGVDKDTKGKRSK